MSVISKKKIDNIVSWRFLIPYLFIFIITIYAITLHFQIVKVQQADSVRINLAGRQRMLTQMMSKKALLYSDNLLKKEKLKKITDIFNVTLYALINGGQAPIDLEASSFVDLPEMENPLTKQQLSRVEKLWRASKYNIEKYIQVKDTAALDYIINNDVQLMAEMNSAVSMMQNSAERNNRNINIILYISYLSIILILTILLVTKLSQLKNAAVYIDRLESILPICASCKKIREPDAQAKEQDSWTEIESYIGSRLETKFSHGMCPSCADELYGDQEWYKRKRKKSK